MELASIRIITHDVDRLAGFYEAVTDTTAVRPSPMFAEIQTTTGTIAIAGTETVAMLGDDAPKPGSNQSVIVEFLVADVGAEAVRLQDVLKDIVLEPTTMPWGNTSTLFRDPDGNLVNLFSRPTP